MDPANSSIWYKIMIAMFTAIDRKNNRDEIRETPRDMDLSIKQKVEQKIRLIATITRFTKNTVFVPVEVLKTSGSVC